jgi:hypothetical protein
MRLLREAAHQVLRALEDEIPAQVAEADQGAIVMLFLIPAAMRIVILAAVHV